jgi:hypothetical protein
VACKHICQPRRTDHRDLAYFRQPSGVSADSFPEPLVWVTEASWTAKEASEPGPRAAFAERPSVLSMERLELELRHAGKLDYDLLTLGAKRPPVMERRMSGLVAGTPG